MFGAIAGGISSALAFFFYCYCDHRDLHSFPTRRSSDLRGPQTREVVRDLATDDLEPAADQQVAPGLHRDRLDRAVGVRAEARPGRAVPTPETADRDDAADRREQPARGEVAVGQVRERVHVAVRSPAEHAPRGAGPACDLPRERTGGDE